MKQLNVVIDTLKAAGLSEDDIVRLALFKRLVFRGERSELTMEYKRLEFATYLVLAGHLKN